MNEDAPVVGGHSMLATALGMDGSLVTVRLGLRCRGRRDQRTPVTRALDPSAAIS